MRIHFCPQCRHEHRLAFFTDLAGKNSVEILRRAGQLDCCQFAQKRALRRPISIETQAGHEPALPQVNSLCGFTGGMGPFMFHFLSCLHLSVSLFSSNSSPAAPWLAPSLTYQPLSFILALSHPLPGSGGLNLRGDLR